MVHPYKTMKKDFTWMLTNVVWYDGVDAYVTKFVLKVDSNYSITTESKKLVKEYLDGNGEILKFDTCYAVTWENIEAYKDMTVDNNAIYQRFIDMWI